VYNTSDFVNINRFKPGKTIKRLRKISDNQYKIGPERRKRKGREQL